MRPAREMVVKFLVATLNTPTCVSTRCFFISVKHEKEHRDSRRTKFAYFPSHHVTRYHFFISFSVGSSGFVNIET